MGLELLICRLLVRRPPCCSPLLHQEIPCVSCGCLSPNLSLLCPPKSLGSFFHFHPRPPSLLSSPPSASLGCCHLIIEKRLLAACLQETLLACFKKRRVLTMYVRCCCSQFINNWVHMCRLKVFPEGWKALRLLVLRKTTWLIVAAFVKSLIERALPGCF